MQPDNDSFILCGLSAAPYDSYIVPDSPDSDRIEELEKEIDSLKHRMELVEKKLFSNLIDFDVDASAPQSDKSDMSISPQPLPPPILPPHIYNYNSFVSDIKLAFFVINCFLLAL